MLLKTAKKNDGFIVIGVYDENEEQQRQDSTIERSLS